MARTREKRTLRVAILIAECTSASWSADFIYYFYKKSGDYDDGNHHNERNKRACRNHMFNQSAREPVNQSVSCANAYC